MAPRSDLDNFGENTLRHGRAGAPAAAVGRLAGTGKQDHVALHDAGEVVLDGRVDIRHIERDSEPAGKCIKIA